MSRRADLIAAGNDPAAVDAMLDESIRAQAHDVPPGEPVPALLSQFFSPCDAIDIRTGMPASCTTTVAARTAATGGSSRRVTHAALAAECSFIHYTCHGEKDAGWGCCYRSLQMCLVEAARQGKVDPSGDPTAALAEVPGLREDGQWPPCIDDIQRILVRHGRFEAKDIGSSRWAEPPDCADVLRAYGVGVEEMELDGCAEADLAALEARLFAHFGVDGDAMPVVVDDVTCAYAVAGICTVEGGAGVGEEKAETEKETDVEIGGGAWGGDGGGDAGGDGSAAEETTTLVLLFDPHVTGKLDLATFVDGRGPLFKSTAPVQPRGSARWVPFEGMFWGAQKWMVALPS
jgi:hypothetical protein